MSELIKFAKQQQYPYTKEFLQRLFTCEFNINLRMRPRDDLMNHSVFLSLSIFYDYKIDRAVVMNFTFIYNRHHHHHQEQFFLEVEIDLDWKWDLN